MGVTIPLSLDTHSSSSVFAEPEIVKSTLACCSVFLAAEVAGGPPRLTCSFCRSFDEPRECPFKRAFGYWATSRCWSNYMKKVIKVVRKLIMIFWWDSLTSCVELPPFFVLSWNRLGGLLVSFWVKCKFNPIFEEPAEAERLWAFSAPARWAFGGMVVWAKEATSSAMIPISFHHFWLQVVYPCRKNGVTPWQWRLTACCFEILCCCTATTSKQIHSFFPSQHGESPISTGAGKYLSLNSPVFITNILI